MLSDIILRIKSADIAKSIQRTEVDHLGFFTIIQSQWSIRCHWPRYKWENEYEDMIESFDEEDALIKIDRFKIINGFDNDPQRCFH